MGRIASLFINDEKNSKPQDCQEKDDSKKQSYKILFVDDEDNVLKAMVRIFRRENYTVLTAGSGPEALDIFRKNPVNVIVSDHRMPGMTGADLLRKIKAEYPDTIRIMLTGNADVNAIMGAVNEGAVYKFITKPWNDEDLRLTVSLALEQYDLIQENKSLKKHKTIQNSKIKQLSKLVDVHQSQVGRILFKKKLITKEDLDKALALQIKKNQVLPVILCESGIIDETALIKVIQSELGINRVYPNEFSVPSALAELIPKDFCTNSLIVPLKRTEGRLIVAMADPTDYMKIDDLKFIAGIPVQPVICTQKEISDKLKELYHDSESVESVISELDLTDPTESIEIILEDDDEKLNIDELLNAKDQPPAIRIVNAILTDAFRHNASDVHIEPKTKYIIVRYRIDGLLQDKIHIPLSMHASIISRIKVMCELDIAERRKPQDGRVTVKTSSRMIDMRISCLPTIGGEKLVLRILDKTASIMKLEELGLTERDLEKILWFSNQPQGMVLTTGPTGSGKTSTLYSLLQQNATITKNYVTIEDPVEYFMGMAAQVSVRNKIGLDFPLVLRAILRQDPNVIMLGEIRDFETAEVALHAALTGHLVLSTLHTNGSIASITRLRDMGIKPYVLSEALIGVIAQRLVRRICPHCITEDDPSDILLSSLRISRNDLDFMPKRGAGCPRCNNTGYSGRIGLFEVFKMNGELKRMIHQDAVESELLEAARSSGMRTLFQDGVLKVKAGLTTLDEILRVLGAQDNVETRCPHCNVYLEEKYSFCPFCGESINPRCSMCGKIMASNWSHCPSCGGK